MRYILLLLITLTASACNKPSCHNNDPIFDKFPPGSKTYNDELVKRLSHPGTKASFWIKGYAKHDNREYMNVEVQAKDMCAQVLMDITGNARLEQFRKVEGMSYQGAELSGLYYHYVRNDSSYSFIFDEVDWIID